MTLVNMLLEWESVGRDAYLALGDFLSCVRIWRHRGICPTVTEFDAVVAGLVIAGLEDWIDQNPAGGGLDRLMELVKAGTCLPGGGSKRKGDVK